MPQNRKTAAAILRGIVRTVRQAERNPRARRAALIDCADRAIRARRLIEGRAR